jgi:hypothetical protein
LFTSQRSPCPWFEHEAAARTAAASATARTKLFEARIRSLSYPTASGPVNGNRYKG